MEVDERGHVETPKPHLFWVDRVNNGRLFRGFVDEQVHIIVREGR